MFNSIAVRIALAMAVLLALCTGVIIFQEKEISNLKTEKQGVIDLAKLGTDSVVTYYKNRLNRETARTSAILLSSRDAADLKNTKDLAFIKQFDALNRRMNNLDQATSTTAKLVANFQIALGDTAIHVYHHGDTSTIKGRKFNNHNKWIELKGVVYPDSIHIDPVVNVPLESVDYWQRNKILFLRIGKKKWFHETTSPNPYVHITKNEVIRIAKRN